MRWTLFARGFGLAGALIVCFAAVGWAQEQKVEMRKIEIVAPPPERAIPPEVVTPGQPPQINRPRESDFRPDNVRTRHDPAFITPATTTVRTGPKTGVRIGLSGWTAPPARDNAVFSRENGGLFGFGLSFVWGVPVDSGQSAPAPPATTR